MKLGLITDIHEQLEPLQAALACFAEQGVEQVVVLGDLVMSGNGLDATCRALAEAGAIGVWGNHDFGLCQLSGDAASDFSQDVADYLAQLKPRLVVEDCLFTHVEPWLNTEDLCDLWFFGGAPDTPERIEKIFSSSQQRVMFAGHYHRWLAASAEGIMSWTGAEPLSLADERYYVIIGAACNGHWATYDTESGMLMPYSM